MQNISRYAVYGVQLRNRADQAVLYDLQPKLDIDLWEYGAPGERDAFIMLSPKNAEEVIGILDANGIKHYLHIADVAK